MTFADVSREYEDQSKKSRQKYIDWVNKEGEKRSDRPVFKIDYDRISAMIIEAIQDKYGFSHKQACFIYGIAYEDHHSCFSDVICYSDYYAERIQRWERLK